MCAQRRYFMWILLISLLDFIVQGCLFHFIVLLNNIMFLLDYLN